MNFSSRVVAECAGWMNKNKSDIFVANGIHKEYEDKLELFRNHVQKKITLKIEIGLQKKTILSHMNKRCFCLFFDSCETINSNMKRPVLKIPS